MKQPLTSYGASVRGPAHKRDGVPNEDAWLRAEGSFGSLIVVCDGMGSRPHARLGARAGCVAVREAVKRWTRANEAPLLYLAHLIEILWRLCVHPYLPRDAATTCLLALARKNGEWVVGGIGDGLVAVKTGFTPVSVVVGDRTDGFSNETSALGLFPCARAWQINLLPPTKMARLAVIATDGIAEDLVPEKIDGFCQWLVDNFRDLDPKQRWRQLIAELRAWPTPRHLDDKTIAILTTSGMALEETVWARSRM